jgi:hypothetical protein
MTGTYRIIEKDVDHRSSLYGAYCDENRQIVVPDVDCTKDERPKGTQFIGASMPFFMRITGGVGMHEGYLPGYPASHGCIRLPREMAEAFYFATPVGTPVEIKGDASLAEARHTAVQLTPPGNSKPKKVSTPPKSQMAAKPAAAHGRRKSNEPFFWFKWGGAQAAQKPAPVPFGSTQYLQ